MIVIWAGFIAAAFAAGAVLRAAGALPVDALPPLHAHARLPSLDLLPAVVVAVVGVVVALPLASRLRWRTLLGVGWLGSAVWAVALQLPDGVARPLTAPTEYLAGLPAMGDDPLGWLRGFTRHLQEYPTHVKGHPPLPMLILWTMQWTGLRGAGWAAALVIVMGSSATVAIAMTVRAVAGERSARHAVPFLTLAPTAIWVATSMDAFFLGVAAWGVALLAMACTRSRVGGTHPPWGTIPIRFSRAVDSGGKWFHRLWITSSLVCVDASLPVVRSAAVAGGGSGAASLARSNALSAPAAGVRSIIAKPDRTSAGEPVPADEGTSLRPVLAFFAGLLFGSLPYLSYGLLSIFALPLAVLLLTRPRRFIVVALLAGCLVVPCGFAIAGFSWFDGMAATHAAWAAGAGSRRPYAYFLLANLAVLALVVGPAITKAHRAPIGARTLITAAFIGVLALDLSGVTRGEVERIWLPYAAWMTVGAAAQPTRRLLVAQVVTALLIQAFVRSPW